MEPLLVGSHRYGTPRDGSDIDVVLRVDGKILDVLLKHGSRDGNSLGSVDPEKLLRETGQVSVRFGVLNLILCSKDEAYAVWVDGLKTLDAEAPVTRERAVDVFHALRVAAGLSFVPKPSDAASGGTG